MIDISCKVAFLDRDGTINIDHGFVHRVEDWQLTEGAAKGIETLRNAGFRIAVVTNQSGVAAGLYTERDIETLHAHMQRELAGKGAHIDAIAYCPHARDTSCECRKPGTGMATQIERQLGRSINYAGSWTIGDKPSDIAFGEALGTQTALIRNPHCLSDTLDCEPIVIAESLYVLAHWITTVEEKIL